MTDSEPAAINRESNASSQLSRVWDRGDLSALSVLSDPAWIYDFQHDRIWWANDAGCRFWHADALDDLCARDLSGSEATRLRLARYAAMFEAGQRVTEQWTFYPRNQPTTASCTCSGIRIDDGRMAMFVVARPVGSASPEDLRGIEALRHTRVKVSLYRWDDGACLMRNPSALSAYPRPDHRFRDRFRDASTAGTVMAALEADGVFSGVVEVNTALGERWHGMDARRVVDPVTGDDAVLVNERDMTDLIRAEEALRLSERRLSHMVEHLPAGAAYVEGERIFLNRAAEEISGYARDVVPTLDAWFKAAYPDDHEEIRRRYDASRTHRTSVSTELQITRADGRRRWIHFFAYLAGRGEVWLFHDVTDHREAAESLRRERAMLQSLIESMPDIVFFKDRDGTYLNCNRAALDYVGIPADRALARRDRDLFDAATAEQRRQTDLAAMEQGFSRTEEWFVYPDGRRVLVETAKAACRDAEGKVLGVVGIARDVTERRQTEDQLRQERALLRGVFDAIPDAIFFKDANGVFRNANAAVASWFGCTPDSMVGKTDADIVPKAVADEFRRNDLAAIAQNGTRRNEETIALADGRTIWVEMLKTPIRDADGTLMGVVGIGRDISERKRIEETLRRSEAEKDRLAHHDALTDLPNRRLFFDRLDMALARSQRSGNSVALLFIDLDGFKLVNDSLGHDAGDHVLRVVAGRLSACLRKSDTIARMGGDEFTAILEDMASTADVALVAEKIIAAVSAPIPIEGQEVAVGASIGIALYPLDAPDARTLLVVADDAMYDAKEAGRGRYVFRAGGLVGSGGSGGSGGDGSGRDRPVTAAVRYAPAGDGR